MDIRLIGSDVVKIKIEKLIKNTLIVLDDQANVVLVERGFEEPKDAICIIFNAIDYHDVVELLLTKHVNDEMAITGFKDNKYTLLPIKDIFYIEVYATQVQCKVEQDIYKLKQTLAYYEMSYRHKNIIQINKSQLVNILKIKEIVPWFNSRLIIKLKNNEELEVSKMYAKFLRKRLDL